MKKPKLHPGLIKIFPFEFVLLYDSQGELNKITFKLHLSNERVFWAENSYLEEKIYQFLGEFNLYFCGKKPHLDLPHKRIFSIFAQRVLLALRDIPYGATLTYGELAKIIGKRGAQRAVGQVLAKNPLPLIYPCHRILAKGGWGGYSQGTLLKWLLLYWEHLNLKESFDLSKK